jgi:hypothetical protein
VVSLSLPSNARFIFGRQESIHSARLPSCICAQIRLSRGNRVISRVPRSPALLKCQWVDPGKLASVPFIPISRPCAAHVDSIIKPASIKCADGGTLNSTSRMAATAVPVLSVLKRGVMMALPTKIARGLMYSSRNMAEVCRHVVLEALAADESQQLLQLRNLRYAGPTKRF